MNRKLLVAGVLALVVLSGCIDALDDAEDVEEYVPEQADAVVHVDMDVLEDDTTEQLANAMIDMEMEEEGEDYDGPESYDEVWDEIAEELDEEGIDLEPRDLHEFVFFSEVPDDPIEAEDDEYAAAVVSADWDEDELLDAIERNATVEADEYNDRPFYEVEPDDELEDTYYLAGLAQGTFSVGEEEAVRDTVDVAVGDSEAFSGELRDELDRLEGDHVRFAMSTPDYDLGDELADDPTAPDLDLGAFDEIDVVSGSYYTDDDTLGTSFNLRTATEEDAEDIESAIDGILFFAGTLTGEVEALDDFLDEIDIEREDSTVVVSYETTVDDIIETMEELDDLEPAGPGPAQPPGEFDEGAEDDFGEELDDDFADDAEEFEEELEEEFEDELEDGFGEDEFEEAFEEEFGG